MPDQPAALYRWPLSGHIRVTCEFGARDPLHNDKHHPRGHGGMDLAASPATPVLAARDGTILLSGAASGYGHWVVIRHGDGQNSIYGHLSVHGLAHAHRQVKAGDVIGRVGTAKEGHTSGPHLHFQVNRRGTSSEDALNPRMVLPPQP